MKKAVALILAVASVLCLVVLPTSAKFSDVSDTKTAENVAVLQTLGVIDGYPDGTFRPSDKLTRAQFTKMAVTASQTASKVTQYAGLTIFPDVRANHWAAGYVNYAVREAKMLIGMPDGNFGPDNKVTYGQAVTILMRLMGYTDEQLGANWPMGYIAEAGVVGLTTGVSAGANAEITRAQAAQLFRNLLLSINAAGDKYINSIAETVSAGVIITSNTATAADGSTGAVSCVGTVVDTFRPVGKIPDELVGRKGTLALNSKGQLLCFIPESDGSSKTVTVAAAAATYVTDKSGTRTNISGATPIYVDGASKNWSELWMDVSSGTVITLYFDAGGKATYGVMASSTTTGTVAVLKTAPAGNPFVALLGLPSGSYKLVKNGSAATNADLRKYDVATYDAVSGTIYVSDRRISGVYESASPNRDTPEKITVLGKEFTLVGDAGKDLENISLGATITLLLTSDMKVAGVVSGNEDNGTAVGIVTAAGGGEMEVKLLGGMTLKQKTTLADTQAAQYLGKIVSVSSYRSGYITVTALSGGGAAVNVAAKTVGTAQLADGARIFDSVGSGAVTEITLGDILTSSVSATRVLYAGKDYAGRVDVLVLNDVTGNCYQYGKLTYELTTDYIDGFTVSNNTITVTNASGTTSPAVSGMATAAMNGKMGGVALAGDGRAAGVVTLTEITGVPRSAFSGDYMTQGGVAIPVSADVQAYIKDQNVWTTLSAARAYSNNLTVYYDKSIAEGGKIRVVVAN